MFHAFPSIDQFRTVVKYFRTRPEGVPPVRKFVGTVKLHGTNAAIILHKDEIRYQSRSQLIDATCDNAGFVAHMSQHEEELRMLRAQLPDTKCDTWIYGEWCGGNIQKGVALNQLAKMFVIFAVRQDDKWLDMRELSYVTAPMAGVWNIMAFPHWEMDIDFSQPELAQNELVKLTEAVEAECPVGKQFGISGIGEGVVWTSYHDGDMHSFKCKGEKHSVSKVKTLAAVDVEKVNSIREFVDYAVTENRMEQGVAVLQTEGVDMSDIKNMGAYLRWLAHDVFKEEMDTLTAAGLSEKDVGRGISDKGRKWFMNRVNT